MAPKKKRKAKTGPDCVLEIDIEENLKARSIIERLSKKYLNKSPNASASVRGTVEISSPSMDISGSSEETTRNNSHGKKLFNLCHSFKGKPKPKRLTSRRAKKKDSQPLRKVLSVSKDCNVSSNPEQTISSCVKVPRPTLGQSTPSNAWGETPSKNENSMFGFEEFETPLGLSPVVSEKDEYSLSRPVSKSPRIEPEMGLSFANVDGVYSVPSHKARKRQAAKKKSGFCESEVKQWVTELKNQFDEIDKFELVVE